MNKLTVFLVPLSLTATTALAGGYVAPVISYEPVVISKPEPKKPFQWTGPYAGISLGHTEIDLKRKVETETPEEVIVHPAITETVTTVTPAVTEEVIIPAVTEEIKHPGGIETVIVPAVTEDIKHPPSTTVTEIPPVMKDINHDAETKVVTVDPVTKDVIHPPIVGVVKEEGKVWVPLDPKNTYGGCHYGNNTCPVPVPDTGEWVVDDNGNRGWTGQWLHAETGEGSFYEVKPGWTETVTVTPGRTETVVVREAWTETVVVTPGRTVTVVNPGWTETVVRVPERVETKIVEPWTETVVVTPEKRETVVVTPEVRETREVVVQEEWTEVVKTAYTSTLFQELKDSANTYGVFGGYRYQFKNNVVIGAEANFTKTEQVSATFENETYNFNLNTVSLEAQVGYAYKRFLPYAALGIASTDGDKGWLAAVGVDYAVTDNIVIGAKYTHYEYNDIQKWEADVDNVSIRAAFKF